MDVFNLRDQVIGDYSDFVKGFIKIRDRQIRQLVDQELRNGLFWPDPLIQLSPCFEPGGSIKELVDQKALHPDCDSIFRVGKLADDGEVGKGQPLHLHDHQRAAIHNANENRNYILTTGTGSGKSLAYIIPIVNHVLNTGSGGGIKAIIVYPMNALANSQKIELEKFLSEPNDEKPKVTFERYTGQESTEEKKRIIDTPPDILLTNFVMLELMLTRGGSENSLIKSAKNLRFLVLDELHTYRGRQGADVAMLVRRTRNATGATNLLCVGTSATLASRGTQEQQKAEIAEVGQRLFGTQVLPSDVICERLRRVTAELDLSNPAGVAKLKKAIDQVARQDGNQEIEFDQLQNHLLASWIETTFGIRSEAVTGTLLRQVPLSVQDAAKSLQEMTGFDNNICREAIQKMLLLGHACTDPNTKRPTFVFRLHQFISRGDTVYASLEQGTERHFTFEKQRFVPNGKRDRRLYPLVFCRHCGHEFYSVNRIVNAATKQTEFIPRDLLERIIGEDDTEVGFLYGSVDKAWPEESDYNKICERTPEEWKDQNGELLKNRKKELPEHVCLTPLGLSSKDTDAISMVFVKSPLRFCPCCGVSYSFRHSNKKRRDFGKVSALGTEGRSSATTVLALSAVRHARETQKSDPSEIARKILSFTDNRQDASLQAGHFNDFIEVSLLRGALYDAVQRAGEAGLRHSELMPAVFKSLNLNFEEYASNPTASKGGAREETEIALWHVLGYRLYCDLERGWRITAPNLEQTGLLEFDYKYLTDLAADRDCWTERFEKFWSTEAKDQSRKISIHPALVSADPTTREQILRDLLAWIRSELAIKVNYLNRLKQEEILQTSFQRLIPPWGFDETDKIETLVHAPILYPRPREKDDYGGKFLTAAGGFGDYLRRTGTFPHYGKTLTRDDAGKIILDLLAGLNQYGIIEKVEEHGKMRKNDRPGFQLVAEMMIWRVGDGTQAARDSIRQPSESGEGQMLNEFFRDYYRSVALLTRNFHANEHTAQVPYEEREKREKAFREGRLPVLFCSPTMELGIDISELNMVNMRNVPPTPANYAQRSGRAGRSGQPALVLTYCSIGSQHDQYFFKRQEEMVAGAVTRPQIDFRNEELIRSHIHAIWLSESDVSLGTSIGDVLDLGDQDENEQSRIYDHESPMNVQSQIAAALQSEPVLARVRKRAKDVLDTISDELQETPWYTSDWINEVLRQIPRQFDDACQRWKQMYIAARRQLDQQHLITRDASRNAMEKKQAGILYQSAKEQLKLLHDKNNSTFSDFYSYRYFAAEGFLPGYNFPRLPLSAYLPGERGRRNDYLSRPRFLAISEFGPRAIVYHEGATYIINKVTLPIREDGDDFLTQSAKVCKKCGYLHPPDYDGKHAHQNNCDRCGEELNAELTDLLRLQNVEAKRRTRINCDEEERLRYGYDIRTAIRFALRGGRISCQTADIICNGKKFARITYGDSATIWRINFGYRRQKEEQRNGFLLDLERGYWGTNHAVVDVDDDPADPMSKRLRMVRPYVSDTKNCLLLEFTNKHEDVQMITLQAALRVGIRRVFELEESELAAEPLPSTNERRMLLFYESAEGGAGVLRQMLRPGHFRQVVCASLEAAHFDAEAGQDREEQKEPNIRCDTGCYHCLLSYSNQFDHEMIDRKKIVDLLLQLRDATLDASPTMRPRAEHLRLLKEKCESELEHSWLDFLEAGNYALPTDAQIPITDCETRPDFAYLDKFKCLIYVDGPPHDFPERQRLDKKQANRLRDAGWEVIRFHHQDDWKRIVNDYSYLFGDGQ